MKTNEKNYTSMTNDEKAQAIYNRLKDQSLTTLSDLLTDLSFDYDTDTIFTVDDWLEEEEGTDLRELIKTAQRSKGLNIDDHYIRASIYYDGYKTSNSVIDLVDEDEAIDWIANALDINDPRVAGLDNMMKANQ